MKLAATVIYVDFVPHALDFYRRAFGLEASFTDLDVQLPARNPEGRYQFASIDTPGGALQFATHDLGTLLMPTYQRPPDGRPCGVEIAFYASDVPAAFRRAVEAGATEVCAPRALPWGQVVAYVTATEGTFVGICSPPTA